VGESTIVNVSGYRFVRLYEPANLQQTLKPALSQIGVKGAVLLAPEGINVNIAGSRAQIAASISRFNAIPEIANLWLKESVSGFVPHKRLKVRVRTEIIAFDGSNSLAELQKRPAAPLLAPEKLNQWLAEKRDITLLDTRNDYEVESGTFAQAHHLGIKHFKHFKQAVRDAVLHGTLDKSQPVVAFCTGGIRCEKAAPWLLAEGFRDVYQLEGGIINYLAAGTDSGPDAGDPTPLPGTPVSPQSHWQGECFVFDDRVELSAELAPTGAGLCDLCQLAVPAGAECDCRLGAHFHATYAID